MYGVYRGWYLGSCSWSLAEVGMEIRYSDFLPIYHTLLSQAAQTSAQTGILVEKKNMFELEKKAQLMRNTWMKNQKSNTQGDWVKWPMRDLCKKATVYDLILPIQADPSQNNNKIK